MNKNCPVILFADEFTVQEARLELLKIDNQEDKLNFLCQNGNVYIYE